MLATGVLFKCCVNRITRRISIFKLFCERCVFIEIYPDYDSNILPLSAFLAFSKLEVYNNAAVLKIIDYQRGLNEM